MIVTFQILRSVDMSLLNSDKISLVKVFKIHQLLNLSKIRCLTESSNEEIEVTDLLAPFALDVVRNMI